MRRLTWPAWGSSPTTTSAPSATSPPTPTGRSSSRYSTTVTSSSSTHDRKCQRVGRRLRATPLLWCHPATNRPRRLPSEARPSGPGRGGGSAEGAPTAGPYVAAPRDHARAGLHAQRWAGVGMVAYPGLGGEHRADETGG